MMRFDSSEIGQTMSEIVAYGIAAIVEPLGVDARFSAGLWHPQVRLSAGGSRIRTLGPAP
jgi:hypothetical protein